LDEAIRLTRAAVETSPEGHPGLGNYLESLAADLRRRYKLSPSIADVREGAEAQRKALELLGNSRGDQANMLLGLAIDLKHAYELEGAASDLDASLKAYEQASQLFPENDSVQSTILHEMGVLSAQRFEMSNGTRKFDTYMELEDGKKAAEAVSRDEAATSEVRGQVVALATGDSGRPLRLCGYADNMYKRFRQTNKMQDLDEAVSLSRQAVDACSTGDPLRCNAINNLGSHLLHQYELTHDSRILDETVTLFSDIVDSTALGKLARATYLANLGDSLLRRHKLHHREGDLQRSVTTLRVALDEMPKQHESRTTVLYWYALALALVYTATRDSSDRQMMLEAKLQLDPLDSLRMAQELYEDTGNVMHLEEEMRQTKILLKDVTGVDPKRAKILSTYSWMLGTHFTATGCQESLLTAVEVARQAVACRDGNPPQLAECMYVLGVQLSNAHQFLGKAGALEEAIQVTRRALAMTTEHRLHMPAVLNSLALRLRARYEQTGDPQALEEALKISGQYMQATPAGSPLLSIASSNHSYLGSLQYLSTGKVADLDDAINLAQQSLRGTPDRDLNKPTFYHFLGLLLHVQYERTLEMASLNESIRVNREAVAMSRDQSPDKRVRARALAECLLSRYERTKDVTALDEAISTLRSCIDTALYSDSQVADTLDALANCLEAKYARSQDETDGNQAIEFGKRATDSSPVRNLHRDGWISNQMTRLRARYATSKDADYLEQAIQLGEQAVAQPLGDVRARAGIWYSLGLCRAMRGDATAVEALYRAWNFEEATPQIRVFAAGECIRLLHALERQEEGMKLGFEILALLPTIHTRSLQQSDQQEVMATFAGIASDLCAICIDQGKLGAALRSLEHGRAVIIGQLLSDRTELPQLSKDRPDLVRRYEALLWEARAPTSSAEMLKRDNVIKGRLRREVMEDLDNCLWEIRAVPGYETFLLPLEHENMQRCPAGGVVAIVNVTSMRSDAILIMNDSVQTIPLPDMTEPEAKKWLAKDWAMKKKDEWYRLQQDFSAYLEWLWNVCVKHVVNVIEEAHARASIPRLPKVWWIGAGYASSMPLHAAGVHTGKSRDNALDRIISSYTPSIKALAAARDQSRRATASKDAGSMLIVTMPTTPKAPGTKRPGNLPNVVHEAAEIVNAVGSTINTNVAQGPSVKTTLAALPTCRIAHFACHGTSDATDPSNSGVILQRLAEDGTLEQDRLTVRHISGLTMERAQVAYLSACSTAENKASRLRDEVLHLASGFLASGFPHVVGCLWPAGDEECVKVAARFYSLLLCGEHGGSREPCRALHEAVVALRDQDPDLPLRWAQFVHYGF
jgi:tetratricopeptide (TPR) repeat protein